METNDNTSRGLVYRTLRAGFRIIPEPHRTSVRDFAQSLVFRGVKPTLKLKVDAYTGKYRCSVCDRRVAFFLPLDEEFLAEQRRHGFEFSPTEAETCNQKNYLCPHCEATDRERLYALYLREYVRDLTPTAPATIVDFAPSYPLSNFIKRLVLARPRTLVYRTADLMMESVDDTVDLMDMKVYRDGSFDFFICSHILEHVENDRKALSELYRILKPGGRGILVVPILLIHDEMDEDPSVTDPAERIRRFGQDDHVRRYSKAEFLLRTQQAGFSIQQLGAAHFGADTFSEHGITEQSIVYIVGKQVVA